MAEGTTDRLATVARAADTVAGTDPITIMEVCGTHTVSVRRSGLAGLLPDRVRLVSGPGCPVCVTPQRVIDQLIEVAADGDVTVATFGDMIRVPGSTSSLQREKARGADVQVVYSIRDALALARRRPDRPVVFAGVGFETTAPGTAVAIETARNEGVENFLVLSAHKWMVPAMAALLAGGDVGIDGFLCPGHVSVTIGSRAYEPLAREFGRPCVVAGFTADQVLAGLAAILDQLASGAARVDNVYTQAVRPEGNPEALGRIDRVFDVADAEWRGLGVIPRSGMAISPEFARFDVERRLDLPEPAGPVDLHGCRCGDVLRGTLRPEACPLFGETCTPVHPQGPCMVSREGACAAAHALGQVSA